MDIAVDFDGTLVDKQLEWLPGAVDALRRMLHVGHRVTIHTCRANWPEGIASVEAKLIGAGLVIPIWDQPGKPAADLYIDDRAVHFDGNWAAITPHLDRAADRQHQAPSIRAKPGRPRRPKPSPGFH